MYSIKTLYKIGNGPSSSHTMGPKNAVLYILEHFPNADFYEMYVYESLALTGVGHLLDYIVEKNYVSIELYDTGWLGEKVFYKKLDKYTKKLKDLGYNIEVIKDIYDENDGVYAHMNFIMGDVNG